nr:hypothetical protein [uncultured Acetatifactor sp.]
MNEKYQLEIENFIKRFKRFQDARIVLYGIGRYTATLLEGLQGFHIVGLMDKDTDNVGKVLFGIPVLDKAGADKAADLVIINTAETYWDVIYSRIRDMKIPVYYLNGERAEQKEDDSTENPFRELSFSQMAAETEKAEVISFDFFDTLFVRSVCNPQDIFRLMEKEAGIPFLQMRDRAKKHVRENYSLNELYRQMELLEKMPQGQLEPMRNREIALEKELLVPREQLLLCLKRLLAQGKEVYIISDMYLPMAFYMDVLRDYGIAGLDDRILLSNERDANKADGTLWSYYSENIVKGRPALHIGDHFQADIQKPGEYGIKAYQAPGAWDMFLHSSLKRVAPLVCGLYAAAVTGCVLQRLFGNPYVFHDRDSAVTIDSNFDMGYCAFGPVILTFLLWVREQKERDGVNKLVFMARDGYFLKEDFEYLCGLLGEENQCCYIGISRQLAMAASVETREDLLEYAAMPYSGNTAEMLEDRFGIKDGGQGLEGKREDLVLAHLPDVERYLKGLRTDYVSYLAGFGLDDDCAVIDIGYYGNNQRYLNKLSGKRMWGYYFNANLSEKNENAGSQEMRACFQNESDFTGENSQVLKRQIYLESFLTAPYGMVKAVGAQGGFVCAPQGGNQKHFQDKKEINQGVKGFIADFVKRFGRFDLKPDIGFIDGYYGHCFGGGMKFSDGVKRSFYNDNAMMNRIESMVFY